MTVFVDGERLSRFDPSLRELWVIHDGTGDDAGPGTLARPLATIQEAVNRFAPAHLPLPFWDVGDDRTVHVLNGGTVITESVRLPDRAGGGVLHIEGEENVLHADLEIQVAAVGVAGFESIERVQFTTGPLTPGANALNSFWRPNAAARAAAGYNNVLEETFEDLTIQANTANTIDVVGDRFFSYFGGAVGDVGDIVAPQITWRPDQGGGFFIGNDAVISSAPLLVTGFIVDNDGTNGFTNFLHSLTGGTRPDGTRPVTAARCRFTSTTSVSAPGVGSVGYHGCLFEPAAISQTSWRDSDLILANCAALGGGLFLAGVYLDAYALYVESGGAQGIAMQRGTQSGTFIADIRGTANNAISMISNAFLGVNSPLAALTVGAAFTLPIFMNRGSRMIVFGSNARLAGSGTFAGIQLSGGSALALSDAASAPFTGPGGNDVVVGQLAGQAYTAVAAGSGANDTAGDMSSYFRSS